MLLCTLAYIIYSIYEEKRLRNEKLDKEIIEEVEARESNSMLTIVIYLVLGVLGLKFGADFVVDNSIIVASNLGLSERFIGMTIVAVGTALPEIITGIISARKDEIDLLLGNVTGSNIINLCLLIGLGAVINPLTFVSDFNSSMLFLIAITIALQLLAVLNRKRELNWKSGVVLIATYFIYIFTMI